MVIKPLERAIQKGARGKWSKIDQNLPTDSFRKLLTWGGGDKQNVDVFYGWSPRKYDAIAAHFTFTFNR